MSIHAEICPVCKGTGKYIEYNKYKEVTFLYLIQKKHVTVVMEKVG